MKKILLAAFLLISVSGFSQKFQLGLKAGANLSNFNGDTYQDVKRDAIFGFHAGAFVGFYLGNHFSLQPEVVFSTQGAKFKDVSTDDKEDFKLTYLNIPVLAKYEFDGGFFLETGPQAGINISGSKFQNEQIKDVTNNADFSWAFGLGFHAPFGLGIDARYNLGLSKVANASFGNPNFKNSVFQLGLFYTIFNNHIHE